MSGVITVNVDLTGELLIPGQATPEPYDVLFNYNISTGQITGLWANSAPGCGANSVVNMNSSFYGPYLDLTGTVSAAGCPTIQFNGAVEWGGSTNGEHLWGGVAAGYEPELQQTQLNLSSSTISVPEPSMLALWILGLAFVFFWRKKCY